MRTLVVLLTFVILVIGACLIYVYSGSYNVAATDEHAGLVSWLLSTTQTESIAAHADELELSVPSDSSSLRNGFRAFDEMCVPCHGAPGVDAGWMGKGLNPDPPELSHAAEEFSQEEIYWIIRHGIKMTGMPALAPTHDDEEILALTAFVEQLPEMSEAEYRRWAAEAAADTTQAAGDGHMHPH